MCLVCDTKKSSASICDGCIKIGWTIFGFQSNATPIPIQKLICLCDNNIVSLPGFCEGCDFNRTKLCKVHYVSSKNEIAHEDYCKFSKI